MRKISFALAVLMLLGMLSALAVPASADTYDAEFLEFDAVSKAVPSGNLLTGTSFEEANSVIYWSSYNQTFERVVTPTGTYMRLSDIPIPTVGLMYKPVTTVTAGIYKFTGYFRMAYEGERTWLRFYIYDACADHTTTTRYGAQMASVYPTDDEWMKVEFYVELDANFAGLKIAGGSHNQYIQSYCIDNFSLVKVDKIPDDYSPNLTDYEGRLIPYFGTKVTPSEAEASNNGSGSSFKPWNPDKEAQYEVQGIFINRDVDFIGTCNANNLTEQMLIDYANSYKDTHVTDFAMNIYGQEAVYPSEVSADFLDQYYYYTKNDPTKLSADHTNTYKIYVENNIDYVEVLGDAFRDLGINYWLSYRMNDAHGFSGEEYPLNKITIPFVYNNSGINEGDKDFRRVTHACTQNSYYHNIFDYTYDEVREHYLKVINESLSMYECDGIELDFQRELRIWHNGGEYAGLDILTDFMREVNRVVAIYEDVYGHEIKVAVRCGSDIETNYSFGYDIIRWAAEGLIDLVNPTSRWRSTDLDIPVAMWTALMHPYGVEVAPGIELLLNSHLTAPYDVTRHSLETLAAASANWLSQGADKIYMYNFFLSGSGPITDDMRVSTTANTLNVGGGMGYFNMITTIGSYEKVMNFNRRMMISYNDVYANWKTEYVYEDIINKPNNKELVITALPIQLKKSGNSLTGYTFETGALRFQIGDIQAGSTVELNFAAQNVSTSNPPTVYVNGEQATFVKAEYVSTGFTKNTMLTYSVPKSTYDDGYMVAEITPNEASSYNAKAIVIDYADIYIKTQE